MRMNRNNSGRHARAGGHPEQSQGRLDSRFRGNDEWGKGAIIICLFLALSVPEAYAARVSTTAKDDAAESLKNAGSVKSGMAVGGDKRTLDVLSTQDIKSMTRVPQTAKAKEAVSAAQYSATYKAADSKLDAGADATVGVTLTNTGKLNWDANGQIRLSYHLYQGNKQLVWDGERTPMPSAVASGGNITLQAKVKAPKDPGVYTLKWDIVHEGVTWFSGQKVATADVTLTVNAPPDAQIEQSKQILSRMVDAFNKRNVDDLMSPVGSTARITLKGTATTAGDYRRSISSSLPFLTDLSWNAQVTSATRDPKTGAVRLRVTSTYSAKLAEPIGVTSASLAKPAELVSAQKRVTDAFNISAEEIYEFNSVAGGQMQATEIVSALPLDAKFLERTAAVGAAWDVKVAVFGLFYYMERNDLGKFGGLIGSDFVNNDDNGFKSNKPDFIESIKSDLDHLTSIDHTVRVEDIQFNGDRTQARVPVGWDRRARIANKLTEWTIKSQKTTLTLRRGTESGFGLVQIEGNPLFGNSSRLTRKTLLRSGELDGTTITAAIVISDARDTALANSTDVPEMPKELVATLNICAGVAGASQTFTYTGAVQSFTVPTYCPLTIKAWGAGGGGGGWAAADGGNGGGGAYATTAVALTKGNVIQIYVSGGGDSGSSSATDAGGGPGGSGYASGGRGGNAGGVGNSGGGGGGGGSTAVTNQSGTLFYVVAAGGGGGGGAATVAREGAAGGAGGQNGTTSTSGGTGGTTGASGSKNGTDGVSPGAALDGGGGGGGGGGYTAGGTGGSVPAGDFAGGGGAGGNSTGTVTAGSDKTPGNSTDADLCAGCAVGGDKSTAAPPGTATRGGNGYVKISW